MANSFSTSYKTTYQINQDLEIKSYWWLLYPDEFTVRAHKMILIFPDGSKIEKNDEGTLENRFWSFTAKLDQIGTYRLEYYKSGTSSNPTILALHYNFTVVENKRPLKKWTITSVINRLLDVCEPIRKGEKPRFRLQGMKADGTFEEGSQAERFDKILAPQFSINSLITQ